MSAIPHSAAVPRRRRLEAELVRAGLLLLAAVDLGLAVFMAAAPHAFFTSVGPFGSANSHYIRDTATFEAALGFGQAVAVRRIPWRVPVLAMTLLQYGLHAVNHLVDIGRSHPHWTGYFDFFSLLATALLIVWMLRVAMREDRSPRPLP
jgi:hypothetical protein